MFWQILLCALAAGGILLALWVLVGALLLPFSLRHSCMVIWVSDNCDRLEQQVRAFAWLMDSGFLRSRLLLVASSEEEFQLAEAVCRRYPWAMCVMDDVPLAIQ